MAFIETEILLAILAGNDAEAQRMVAEDMLPGERRTFRKSVETLLHILSNQCGIDHLKEVTK